MEQWDQHVSGKSLAQWRATAHEAVGRRVKSARYEKHKTGPVLCERWLTPHPSGNVVGTSSQGEGRCLKDSRNLLAETS